MATLAIPRARRRSGVNLSRIISALIASVVIGAAGYVGYQRFYTQPPAMVAQQTAQATRGSIASTVSATGTAGSTNTTALSFSSSGSGTSRIDQVLVSVGDSVTAGQVLARLETTSLQLAVQQAQAALGSAQAMLQETLTGATPQEITVAQAGLTS